MIRRISRILRSEHGLTLIELMVVVAIVAILAVLFITQLSKARAQAVDGRALDYLDQMRRVMALYYARNGVYPIGGGINQGAANTGAAAYTALTTLLQDTEALPTNIADVNLVASSFTYYPSVQTPNGPANTYTIVAQAVNGTGSVLCVDPSMAVNLGPNGAPAQPGVRCQ